MDYGGLRAIEGGEVVKICVLGSSSTALCQIGAVREGISSLGHTPIVDYTDPDTSFVFVGNGPYSSYLDLARSKQRKVIFNVLDCPVWCREWPELKAQWTDQLPLAHKVTCISKTVQRDLAEFFGIKADVIYYPSKPVRFTGEKKYPFKVAMMGRLRDPGKRAGLAIKSLICAGFNESEVAMIGPEYPGWGTAMGTVNDETLNDIYNSVDYVLMTSRVEGIGLPGIEAAICGAIPIVCPDLSVYNEFWADTPMGIHYQALNSPDSISSLIRSIENDKEWKAALKTQMREHGERVFRPLFDRTEVAKRIMVAAL